MTDFSSPPTEQCLDRSMASNWLYAIGYMAVIGIALFQRGSLALANREANDNHYQVIQLLSEGIRSLSMEDCKECFHPKLFYVTCALLFGLVGSTDADAQIVLAQFVNCIAGATTLLVIWLGLRAQRVSVLSLYLTFAWCALNPRFIGINSQASNDSFAILFTTLAIYFTWRLLNHDKVIDFTLAQLSLSCAILSKGTSWPAAVAILLVLLARSVLGTSTCIGKPNNNRFFELVAHAFRGPTRKYAVYSATCVAVCALSVKYGDYDFKSYDTYANLGKGKALGWFERTTVGRPGVISIADSYFTFRFIDLLKNPINIREQELNPMHRSSVWTQLYGRLHCIQFDYHPSSWRTESEFVRNLNRVIFAIAILWLGAAMLGFANQFRVLIRGIRNAGFYFLAQGDRYFHLLAAGGYLVFIVYFTYSYRDFAAMKVIYMFPGLLSFAVLLQSGVHAVEKNLRRHPKCKIAWIAASLFLCMLYVWNVELLIEHLERVVE